jgi:hypothetical protein
MKAAREKSAETTGSSTGGENGDDEEPAWSGIIHKPQADSTQSAESAGEESQGDESPVDRVLRIIPGTLVN